LSGERKLSLFVALGDGDAVLWLREGVEGDVPWALAMSSDVIMEDIMRENLVNE
jgi:hypothetical protein